MRFPSFFKKTSFQFSAMAVVFVTACLVLLSTETMADRAKRISFPNQTHANINYVIRNLNLEKLSVAPQSSLLSELNLRQLKPLSSFFEDKKSNIIVNFAQDPDQQIIFTVIRNNKIIQIQKVNEINGKTISLQYGKINLDMEKPIVATHQASDIF